MPAGRTSPDDVFINCPFDDAYASLFQTIIFAIYVCGFQPRSARESDDGGQVRLEKLYDIIEECRYGIHDLSRAELDAANGLPRFNMPLELGIFLGCRRYGGEAQREKRLLILDVEQYRYQQFISDLAGMDIHAHGGEPTSALVETRNWLAVVSRRKLPSGPRLTAVHAQFLAACRCSPRIKDSPPIKSPMSILSGWSRAGWSKRRLGSEALPTTPTLASPRTRPKSAANPPQPASAPQWPPPPKPTS